nr:unnamed protein product [Callosobruchus analis]
MIGLTNFADDTNIAVGEKLIYDRISRSGTYFDKERKRTDQHK